MSTELYEGDGPFHLSLTQFSGGQAWKEGQSGVAGG
jgi:hypothetical protein